MNIEKVKILEDTETITSDRATSAPSSLSATSLLSVDWGEFHCVAEGLDHAGFRLSRGTWNSDGRDIPTWNIDRVDDPAWQGVWNIWFPENPWDEKETLMETIADAYKAWDERRIQL